MTASTLDRFKVDLQAQLERAVASPVQLLHEMMSVQIDGEAITGGSGWVARPRGILCLMVCDSLSGNYHRALPAAASLELAYLQFVVHGRIDVTGNQIMGNTASIEGRWGSGQAINAGDSLHAKARLVMTQLADHGCDDETVLMALRALDEACARTCEGLHSELLAERDITNIDSHREVVGLKLSPLMGCAARLGALVAGSNGETQESFHQCGSDLGVALQILEDISTSQTHTAGLDGIARHKINQARECLAQLDVSEANLALLESWFGAGPEEGVG